MAITEGVWDCSSCNRTNRGRDRLCVSCNSPREADEPFRPVDDVPEVTDPKLLEQAAAGADWHCRACGSGNPATNPKCRGCGASREDKSVVRSVGIYVPPKDPNYVPLMTADLTETRRSLSSARSWILGSAVLCFLFVGLIYYFFFRVSSYEGVVVSKTWELQIPIEQLIDRPGRGWDVPAGAVVTSQYMQVKGTREVQIGTVRKTKMVDVKEQVGTRKVKTGRKIDLGNGFFKDEEVDEPVYKTKRVPKSYDEPVMRTEDVLKPYYHYTEKVPERRMVKAIGTFEPPTKPQFALAANERELDSVNVLTVMIAVDGKEYPYSPKDTEEWMRLKEGSRVIVQMTQTGKITKIE